MILKKLKVITIFLISTFYGCARIEVIDTGMTTGQKLAPTKPNEIFIYRSQKPNWEYQEIGLVSVNGIEHIDIIYQMIRAESSSKGAEGVIDFDLESEEITTTSTSTSCMPQGGCTTTTTLNTTIVYTASGTLIIKKRV